MRASCLTLARQFGARFLVVLLGVCFVGVPAAAHEPLAPGLHDLVVYDPGTHERGFPAVQINPDGDGHRQVEIPPAVHVHRYYYSGDKEIQGPIIAGGPTVVVANHPQTGERMYVDVMLPAGAPRIAYDKHGITYVYPKQRVEIKFQCFPFDPHKAVVKQYHGQGWGRNLQDAHEHVSEHVKQSLTNSPAAQSAKECAGDTSDFLHGVKVQLGDMSTATADGLRTLTNMVPGVTYLKSLAEEEANKDYASAIRGALKWKERTEPAFVPTNQ